MPDRSVPETTLFDDLVHQQISDLVQRADPDVPFKLKVSNAEDGVDIEIPVEFVSKVGFRYAVILPRTRTAYSSFANDLSRWNLPSPVLAITYDREGNIYYGFPWGPLGLPLRSDTKRKFPNIRAGLRAFFNALRLLAAKRA
jgi:hypothetical protein